MTIEEDKATKTTDNENNSVKGKSRIAKIILWTLASPFLLLFIISVLIYIPPIQQFLVDKAAEIASAETGMEVSVGRIRLNIPLNLRVDDVLAVREDGDTVLSVGTLGVNVRLAPLFKKKIEIDELMLAGVKIDTGGMIDECSIAGNIGELNLKSHGIDIDSGLVVLNAVDLADADMNIAFADSVTNDSAATPSEPINWRIDLRSVNIRNVDIGLNLPPSADSISTGASIGCLRLAGMINLGRNLYDVDFLDLSGTSLRYDAGSLSADSAYSAEGKGFQPNHILLSDINVRLDSIKFVDEYNLNAVLTSLSANERSGISISGAGRASIRNGVLEVPDLSLETEHSSLRLNAEADLIALGGNGKGVVRMNTEGFIGKADLTTFVPDFENAIGKALPESPAHFRISSDGTTERFEISALEADIDNVIALRSKAVITDIADSLNMGIESHLGLRTYNLDQLKDAFAPETASSFVFPQNMTLLGAFRMKNKKMAADAELRTDSGAVMITSDYDITSDSYIIDVDADSFVVNQFVPMDEAAVFSGSLSAEGRGFDFFSKHTSADLTMMLRDAKMGSLDIGNTHVVAKLANNDISFEIACSNPLLRAEVQLDGNLKRDGAKAHLFMDVPFADISGLGFSDSRLEVSTKGIFDVSSDFGNMFSIDSYVDGIEMVIGLDSIKTEYFELVAMTTPDTTAANISTGDFEFNFNSPSNLFALLSDFETLGEVALEQISARQLNLASIRDYMPTATLSADIGDENPITKVLAVNGVKFSEINADLSISPEQGLLGNAHLYGYATDSAKIDTAYINLYQDSANIVFDSGVISDPIKKYPGFKAYLDGKIAPRDIDAHIAFYNGKGRQGIDFGMRANANPEDTTLRVSFYPEKPILAYSQFSLNADNFVEVKANNKIWADVRLNSLQDQSRIELSANAEDLQQARLLVSELNIANMLAVVPFLPKMDGLLSIDAMYKDKEDNYYVGGSTWIDEYTYEGMRVGDLKMNFDYEPAGAESHDVYLAFSRDGQDFASLEGVYDTSDEERLDATIMLNQLPLDATAPFIPDQAVGFSGGIDGLLNINGPVNALLVNGQISPKDMMMHSDIYALRLKLDNAPIIIDNSNVIFDEFKVFGANNDPLTLKGNIDFSDMSLMRLGLSLYGQNFQLIDSKRTRKSVLFGKVYGDFFTRLSGTTKDLALRGYVNILSKTNMTYVMADTPLSVDYRLDDIVTFVDFTAPPDTSSIKADHSIMGIDMNVQLVVEDGAQFHCEFSADRQNYIDVQGGGSLTMNYTPEGVISLQGRYTINEGEMKYTLPVIPLKTFTIKNGSYIDFTGEPMNPSLNLAATERMKASVSANDGASRSVAFDVGLKVTNTLSDMGLEFTIDAPEDMSVQNELAAMSPEEKNKLAVAMLATGMYLASSNEQGFNAGNALNNFLQNEINNIAGQALNTAVDVNVGMEQNMRDDGSTRTDYSFKFSKRFFSNRLNVIIGGKVSTDGNTANNESGAFIDDISLEWRLDDGGTRYVRIFHEKNYDNLFEGELVENGAGIVLRKKMDRLSELFIFKSDRKRRQEQQNRQRAQSTKNVNSEK